MGLSQSILVSGSRTVRQVCPVSELSERTTAFILSYVWPGMHAINSRGFMGPDMHSEQGVLNLSLSMKTRKQGMEREVSAVKSTSCSPGELKVSS